MVASLRRMHESRISDPWDADFSYCLPTGNSRRLMNWLKLLSTLLAVLGLLAVVISVPYAIVSFFFDFGFGNPWYLSGTVFAAGFASLVASQYIRQNSLTVLLRGRHRALKDHPGWIHIRHVDIENALTFSMNRIKRADHGQVVLDRTDGRVIVEGVLFRYQILVEDLTKLVRRVEGKTTTVQLSVTMADSIPLHLILLRESYEAEEGEDSSTVGERLYEQIADALSDHFDQEVFDVEVQDEFEASDNPRNIFEDEF
ncbi:hypothetical protein Pla110_12240 [Polystyrenella longa]|uniref:Uncharacterized protein n=2 Tax=Polystyrenella longa TaxID=2528007 RepID=A0A518CK08_9PLAN|nr:hypothetical protein Pla110_12240 [Polystyrenella longa]